MSLDACIANTAAELGIDRKDAREIADRLAAERAKAGPEGAAERLRTFARGKAEEARIAAALKRKQAALNVLVRDAADKFIDARVAAGRTPAQAIAEMLVGSVYTKEGVSQLRVATEGKWLNGMLGEAREKAPAAFDMIRRKPAEARPFFDDVVREMAELREGGEPGRTGNKDARALAHVFAHYGETSRLEANRVGANIGRLDGWAGPQRYDDVKMLRLGEARFVERVFAELDRARSFGEGTTDEEVRQSLRRSFRTIVTGRDALATPAERGERLGPSNIANSLGEHRVWHFRDADAWLRVNAEFGKGHITDGMIDHLRKTARKVSLMEKLGPNPEVMLRSLMETRAREIEEGIAPGDPRLAGKEIGRLKLTTGFFGGTEIGKAWAVVSGGVNVPGDVSKARFFANARAVASMAKLGAMLASQFSDLATMGAAMRDQGRGVFQGQFDAIHGMLAGGGEAAERRGMLLGVAGDSMLGDFHALFDDQGGMPGKIGAMHEAFYKWTGARWWQDRGETVVANLTSANLAAEAKHGWAGVNPAIKRLLGLYGIGADRWEVMRQAVHVADDGRSYLMPGEIGGLPDEAFHGLAAGRMGEAGREFQARESELRRRDTEEAGWVRKRLDRFREKMDAANTRLNEFRNGAEGRRAAKLEELDARMELVQARAEQANVLAEIVSGERGMAQRGKIEDMVRGLAEGAAAAGREAVDRAAARGETAGKAGAKASASAADLRKRIAGVAKDDKADAAALEKRIAARREALGDKLAEGDRAFLARWQERDDRLLARGDKARARGDAEGLSRYAEAIDKNVRQLEAARDRLQARREKAEAEQAAAEGAAAERQAAARGRDAEAVKLLEDRIELAQRRAAEAEESLAHAADKIGARMEGVVVGRGERTAARAGAAFERGASSAYRSGERVGRRVAKAEARIKELGKRGGEIVAETDKSVKAASDKVRAMLERRDEELRDFIERARERQKGRAEEIARMPAALADRVARIVARERHETEMAARAYLAEESRHAMLKGDDRARMTMTQGVPPGGEGLLPLGEVVRMVMQFKTFTAAYMQGPMARQFLGQADQGAPFLRRLGQGTARNVPGIAGLIAFSTFYGYLSMTTKDVLRNRTPKDPRKPAAILAALVQGGGAGLYGDYLFGQYDRMGGGVASSLPGPLIGEASRLVDTFQKMRSGDAKAGDLVNLALSDAPFVNLHILRAALDLAVLNRLQEWASPGTFKRREGTVLKQFGQHYIVPPLALGGGH